MKPGNLSSGIFALTSAALFPMKLRGPGEVPQRPSKECSEALKKPSRLGMVPCEIGGEQPGEH